jgi:hypothetical protein
MVRTVKTKAARSLTKGQRAILLPGPTGAEPWELWFLHGKATPELVQMCVSPHDNRLRKSTTLALPVSQVYCLPLWLNETDPKLFAGIIPLQLELRGLQPRGTEPAVFDFSVVAQEGPRTLVVVGVLPAVLSPDINTEDYDSFDLSARYLPFPENTLTIWREHDRLAVAITRGPQLVYYQALAEGQITTRVVQDLSCAQATLAMQDILLPLQKMLVWAEVSPEELTALHGALPLPIEQEECPPPVAPRQAWKLVPSVVGEARRTRASRAWQVRALGIFLLVYLVAVGWLVWREVATARQVAALHQWQAGHEEALDLVHQGRAGWRELGPVVDTKNYPLELLLETYQSIDLNQLHLTLFETGGGHVLIKGEAKNVAGAFQLFNKLKGDPYFSDYNLVMANPHPLPNDLAQFQIEGTRASN